MHLATPESNRLELEARIWPVSVELEVEEVAVRPLIGLNLKSIMIMTTVVQAMALLSISRIMMMLVSTSCRLMSLIVKKLPTVKICRYRANVLPMAEEVQ